MNPIELDPKNIRFKAIRSRGPGGQNVNKVSSAALLLWHFEESGLDEASKQEIRTKLASFINSSGILYLRCDEFRDLEQNKRRCLDKLKRLLERAFRKAKPRKKTKPSFSSVQKRLQSKRGRSEIKKYRQRPSE